MGRPQAQFDDDAVKKTRRLPGSGALDAEAHLLADQLVEVNASGVLGLQIQLKTEQPANRLVALEATQQQLVIAERRRQVEIPVRFEEGHYSSFNFLRVNEGRIGSHAHLDRGKLLAFGHT